jgi:RNA-splicing ligase RtcB
MPDTTRTSNKYGEGEVRSWASILEYDCLQQAQAISRVPIVQGYVALMPDAHFGFGPPVGSAIITHGGVMPYAVGVDIGCGMIAVETNLSRSDFVGHENRILGNIRELIPSGTGEGRKELLPQWEKFVGEHGLPDGLKYVRPTAGQTAASQFGTLGSGNHFVEVCEQVWDFAGESTGAKVWLVLHSGSRGIGNQLATHHVRVAKELCREPLENKDFAWLESGTEEAIAYIQDMLWAQRYAYSQREAMMDCLIEAVERELGWLREGRRINCHHNYAEKHGTGLLTRKGAINAERGSWGIIPGSMGAATYIVRGLGNFEAYNTSPHGAGRLLGRSAAKRSLDVEEFKEQMKGKAWQDRDAQSLLDEAPSAYKPIETVIADSKELVAPYVVLSQFINYKGL